MSESAFYAKLSDPDTPCAPCCVVSVNERMRVFQYERSRIVFVRDYVNICKPIFRFSPLTLSLSAATPRGIVRFPEIKHSVNLQTRAGKMAANWIFPLLFRSFCIGRESSWPCSGRGEKKATRRRLGRPKGNVTALKGRLNLTPLRPNSRFYVCITLLSDLFPLRSNSI